MEENFFNKTNYIGILVGIGLLIIGFICLGTGPVNGSVTLNVAPVILTLTYCVVFPVAILWKKKKKEG